MKKLFLSIAMLFAAVVAIQAVEREHRSVWMTPFLREWPGQAITANSYSKVEYDLQKYLDQLANNGFNAVYYHVRSNCDANYDSAYEPWSSSVSTARGTKPYADPLKMMVEEAHKRGIEVYAWVNPYRYSSSTSTQPGSHGSHPLNYENSHPDWLIFTHNVVNGQDRGETILNPALEEVQQRIVDVCLDIVTKYDVDGLVFDDYFYTNGTKSDVDAAQYAASGTSLPLADWRRENVNTMIRRVGKAIKAVKPYLTFGVGPAGVANHPAAAYPELPVSPGAGYQYNGIYSDPMAWMKEGTIDFISPQVYWTTADTFKPLVEWWYRAARYYNCHSYISTDLKYLSQSAFKTQEYINQIEYQRSQNPENQGGVVYFSHSTFIDHKEAYNGDARDNFYNILGKYAFPHKALNPLVAHKGTPDPKYVTGIKAADGVLSWDNIPGVRYSVYAVPNTLADGQFNMQKEYLAGVTYTNSFTLPAGVTSDTHKLAVAVYDRFGYEYSAVTMGEELSQASAATLVSPAAGVTTTQFDSFVWEAPAGVNSTLIIADNRELATPLHIAENATSGTVISSLNFLRAGVEYFWAVETSAPGKKTARSEVRSFSLTVPVLNPVESPASLTPEISWKALAEGVTYTLDLSTHQYFNTIEYSAETAGTSIQVPEATLCAYTTYYARLTASKGDVTLQSAPVEFRTLEMEFTDAPEFLNPAADGQTIHCNETIRLKPITGISSYTTYIAASASFPSRSRLTFTGTESKPAGEMKISSKNLVDGTTYYVKAVAIYSSSKGSGQKTPESAVRTFVYDENAGVLLPSDDSQAFLSYADLTVTAAHPADLTVTNMQGQVVLSASGVTTLSVASLPAGVYIVKSPEAILKITR